MSNSLTLDGTTYDAKKRFDDQEEMDAFIEAKEEAGHTIKCDWTHERGILTLFYTLGRMV